MFLVTPIVRNSFLAIGGIATAALFFKPKTMETKQLKTIEIANKNRIKPKSKKLLNEKTEMLLIQ